MLTEDQDASRSPARAQFGGGRQHLPPNRQSNRGALKLEFALSPAESSVNNFLIVTFCRMCVLPPRTRPSPAQPLLASLAASLYPHSTMHQPTKHHDRLEELRKRSAEAEAGGGAERREREHKEGKLSARERIDLLLDEGSFEELDKFVRHRCTDFGMATMRTPRGRWIRHWLRPHRRPACLRFRAGFHCLWRLTFRSQCFQDHQDHGSCHAPGRSRHRPE